MSDRQYATDAKTMNEETLSQAFSEAGAHFGFKTVTAEFSAFKEFKVRWSRTYSQAHFTVSDYLKDAPYEVIHDLAMSLFRRIAGAEDSSYGEAMRTFLLAPEFAEGHTARYLSRCRNLCKVPQGTHRNLEDSVSRLVDAGLIDPSDLKGVSVVWDISKSQKAASYSVLFKVIAVNSLLDAEDVPEVALDFAIYSQWLKISEGAKVFGTRADVYTHEQERKFPNYDRAWRILDRMDLYL